MEPRHYSEIMRLTGELSREADPAVKEAATAVFDRHELELECDPNAARRPGYFDTLIDQVTEAIRSAGGAAKWYTPDHRSDW